MFKKALGIIVLFLLVPFSQGYAYDTKVPAEKLGATNPDSIQSNNRQYTFFIAV